MINTTTKNLINAPYSLGSTARCSFPIATNKKAFDLPICLGAPRNLAYTILNILTRTPLSGPSRIAFSRTSARQSSWLCACVCVCVRVCWLGGTTAVVVAGMCVAFLVCLLVCSSQFPVYNLEAPILVKYRACLPCSPMRIAQQCSSSRRRKWRIALVVTTSHAAARVPPHAIANPTLRRFGDI